MKIIEPQKKVNYFGLNLIVPNHEGYLATNKNGEVWWYLDEPEVFIDEWCLDDDESNFFLVAKVDLEDLDWRDTLFQVE